MTEDHQEDAVENEEMLEDHDPAGTLTMRTLSIDTEEGLHLQDQRQTTERLVIMITIEDQEHHPPAPIHHTADQETHLQDDLHLIMIEDQHQGHHHPALGMMKGQGDQTQMIGIVLHPQDPTDSKKVVILRPTPTTALETLLQDEETVIPLRSTADQETLHQSEGKGIRPTAEEVHHHLQGQGSSQSHQHHKEGHQPNPRTSRSIAR